MHLKTVLCRFSRKTKTKKAYFLGKEKKNLPWECNPLRMRGIRRAQRHLRVYHQLIADYGSSWVCSGEEGATAKGEQLGFGGMCGQFATRVLRILCVKLFLNFCFYRLSLLRQNESHPYRKLYSKVLFIVSRVIQSALYHNL